METGNVVIQQINVKHIQYEGFRMHNGNTWINKTVPALGLKLIYYGEFQIYTKPGRTV